jgi:hypothetical protein
MEYQILRVLLVVYAVGAFVLSLFYLRYRRCTTFEYALWGTLALIVPVLGPFFVIAARPGPRKHIKRTRLSSRAMPSPKG